MAKEKDYWKTYYENNKDKCREKMRKYSREHREELTEKHRSYYQKNKDKIEAWRREWRRNKRAEKLADEISELTNKYDAMEKEVLKKAEKNLDSGFYDGLGEDLKALDSIKAKLDRKRRSLAQLIEAV